MNQQQRPIVGEIRPSQLLYTYGVGAIIDLPDFSVIVAGIDDWPVQPSVVREITEERLLAAVRNVGPLREVQRFLAPPVDTDSANPWDPFSQIAPVGVPVATFPRWMVCPACRLLASIDSGLFKLPPPRRYNTQHRYVHENCNVARQPVAVPARFVVACEKGHLDDFPWVEYVHGVAGSCGAPLLRLFEYGPSGEARDLVVRCEHCKAERRLAEAFGRQNRHRLPNCLGRRPHLRDYDPAGCDRPIHPLVLGASNAWFARVLSSIAIPGATTRIDQLVAEHWADLDPIESPVILTAFRRTPMLAAFSMYGDEALMQAIQRHRTPTPSSDDPNDLRLPEWRVFTQFDQRRNTDDFRLRPVATPTRYAHIFEQVVLVERLREVQALTGFTRIDAPGEALEMEDEGEQIRTIAPLSRQPAQWLPAIEVFGEGVFLQLREEVIRTWLERPTSIQRARAFHDAHRRWCQVRAIDPDERPDPGMRYVLLHSFTHALMRQMAMEAGYTAASIRERIYAREAGEIGGPMAGILLYTAASDSEGTLGGLVKLGEPETLERHILAALENAALCASDPTCAEHGPSDDAMSLHAAACHACLFAPETSCEKGNRYLDRSVLVETFAQADLAFFAETL